MSPFLRTSDTPPDPSSTVPRERDPLTGRAIKLDHDDKNSRHDDGTRRHPGREPRVRRPRPSGRRMLPGPRWLVPVGAAGATVAVVVGVVLATTGIRAPVLDADTVTVTGTASGSVTGSPGGAPLPAGGTSLSSARPTTPSSSATASPAGPISVSRSARASSTPARTTRASAAATPTSRSTPSSSTAAGPPAALTASRIWGYRISSPAARVVNPEAAGTTGDQVFEGVLRCPDGRCPAVTGQGGIPAFTAASARIFQRTVLQGRSTPCDPLVFTVELVRGADGSYRGTSSVIPGATDATWNGGISRCTSYSVERSYTLSPLVEQAPAPAGTPAALDPARITGYRYPGADDTGAEYLPTCTDGWCTLQCPLEGCTATVAFPAAPTRFTIPAVPLTTTDCGAGTVGFVVDRDANGVVVFTVARATSTATQVCRRPEYLQATPVTR